jgi:two-component system sensor histidine kinase KdpD
MPDHEPKPLYLNAETAMVHHDEYRMRATFRGAIAHRFRALLRLGIVFLRPYIGSLGLALAALAIAVTINVVLDVSSLSRVFLVAVLVSAVCYGAWPAMFAALLSIILYDFFFLPPTYSLAIHSTSDVINLVSFAVTALLVIGLAAYVRRHAALADKRALTAENLSAFANHVRYALTTNDVLIRASGQISMHMKASVVILLMDKDRLVSVSAQSGGVTPDPVSLERLRQSWATRSKQGKAAEAIQLEGWYLQSYSSGEKTTCLIGIRQDGADTRISVDRQHFLRALAQQTAWAIEHNDLRQRLDDARLKAKSEEFGTALLNSISHDLRGPLTSILGATSALKCHGQMLADRARIELISIAHEQAEHLSGYITNLLDITRIEAGVVIPRLESVMLADLVGSAIYKARATLAGHRLATDVPHNLPLAAADVTLLRQAVENILNNTAKYAPEGSLISIIAELSGEFVSLTIQDEGPGLPEAELDRIFDKFFRSPVTRAQQPGTGLGLTICRGVINAMHGTISAHNRSDRSGLRITISLPVAPQTHLIGVE